MLMETIWFCLFWGAIATFAVFGGTDIGVGILHFLVGRTEGERGQVIQAIHQVWKPNQVWLVAIGGMMFVAFPQLVGEALSGFYLAIMLVLWLLVGRGTGIELRDRVADGMWFKFWDAMFCVSSALLALCLGAALGNFVRGVPRDAGKGGFFEALWTNFRVSANPGILDWFTILIGVTAVIALMYQGALWLNRFTDGAVQERAARLARGLWVALVAALVVCVAVSYFVQPQVRINVAARWWGLVLPVAAVAALVGSRVLLQRGCALRAYVASGVSLYAVMGCVAFGLYPYVLAARDPGQGLTVFAAAAPRGSLELALWWWVPAFLIVGSYFAYVYSKMPEKFSVGSEGE
jgi:cytochrome bd ubiquinol oxidase subunit II